MGDDNRSYAKWVWLVWGVFVLRSVAYVSITPLWEGFDEHAHFAFVQHVAERAEFPVQRKDTISMEIRRSLENLPLPREPKGFGVGKTHDDWWKMTAEERARAEAAARRAPLAWRVAPSAPDSDYLFHYEAQHGPLYYLLAAVPYRLFYHDDIVTRAFAVRFFSILLASTTILAGFAVFRTVFGDERLALLLVAVMAFIPGLMTDTCRVGNDSLSVALLSASVALAVCTQRWTWRSTVLLGLLAAAGLLTKLYFAATFPAFLGVLGVRFLKKPRQWGAFWRHTLVFCLIALGLSSWWFIRSAVLYGSPLGIQQLVADVRISFWNVVANLFHMDWAAAVKTTLFSHIWFGNWSFLVLRTWIYQAFALLYLGALVGAGIRTALKFRRVHRLAGKTVESVMGLVRNGRPETGAKIPPDGGAALVPDRETLFPPGSVILLSFYFWLNAGLLYYASLMDLVHHVSGVPGWYVYTAILPETAWLFLGLWLWYPPAWKMRVGGCLLAFFSLLDLYGLVFILVPYYTGITSHNAGGYMNAFKPFSEHAHLLREIPGRLTAGKPAFMGEFYFTVLAGIFFLLTALALVLAFRLIGGSTRLAPTGWRYSHPGEKWRRKPRPDESEPGV